MKKLLTVLFLLCVILTIAAPASANSAEPPGLIILSSNLPEDAVITLEAPNAVDTEFWRSGRTDKLWEAQYRLWFRLETNDLTGARIRVTTGEGSFTCPLPQGAGRGFSTVMTLDYQAQTLTLDQNPWRQPLLTALRILLTLLTEGLLFWLFGFRSKRSCIVFLCVNLLTQGWLNIWVNSYAFSNTSYWVILLIAAEALIFLAESIALPLLLREKKTWQRVVYALTANAVSLFVGILLIGQLPL